MQPRNINKGLVIYTKMLIVRRGGGPGGGKGHSEAFLGGVIHFLYEENTNQFLTKKLWVLLTRLNLWKIGSNL